MTKIKPILVLLFSLCLLPLNAQFWLTNEDIYAEAEEFIDAEEYIEALPLYQLLEKKELLNANINYKIGLCYLNINGKKLKSIPYLEQAGKNISCSYQSLLSEETAPVKALLLLGVAYRINYEFDKAIETFNSLKDSLQNCDTAFIPLVDWHIDRCVNAKQLQKYPNKYKNDLVEGDVNNQYSNYNPVVIDDTMIYYMDELKFYDALMVAKSKNELFVQADNLTPVIGSDGDHVLVGSATDGKQLFLYNYSDQNTGDIFVTDKTEGSWSKVHPIDTGEINSPFNETYASFCSEDSTLYFTSNRTGTKGGADIFTSKLQPDNTWSKPVNIGDVINTIYNEASPCYLPDEKRLIFSSQGHLNMGGYDIFYSQLDSLGKWSVPINLGYPVSTPDDDIFYYPVTSTVGYMSRYLPNESEQYDIYKVVLESIQSERLYALICDYNNMPAILKCDSVNFNIYEKNTLDTVFNEIVNTHGTQKALVPSGDYAIEITNDKDEILAKSSVEIENNLPIDNITVLLSEVPSQQEEDLSIAAIEEKNNEQIVEVPTASEDEKVQIKAQKIADTLIVTDILFAFDSYTVKPEYRVLIDSVANILKNTTAIIKLFGNTDNLGSAEYNKSLSEKRAQAVKEKLSTTGVNPDNILIIANGENTPICLNQNSDGTDCFKGRQYNRRVKIEVTNSTEKVIFIYKRNVPKELLDLNSREY